MFILNKQKLCLKTNKNANKPGKCLINKIFCVLLYVNIEESEYFSVEDGRVAEIGAKSQEGCQHYGTKVFPVSNVEVEYLLA